MILGFIRLIFFFIIACFVYLFVRLLLAPLSRRRPSRPDRMESGVMVKDEVCNTYLPREDAMREIWQGKEFFFCSPECRRKFLEGRKRDG